MTPFALILLAAAPATARTEAAPYTAAGTEPFWSLEIGEDRMTFRGVDERPLSVPAPKAIVRIGGERYVARGMTVDVTHRECSDGMSDRRYADTVRIVVGGRSYSGCGGGVLTTPQGTLLANSRWTVDAIDGRPLRLRRPATLAFDGSRISGRVCNSFSGSYRFWRGTLTAGPLAGTRMACLDPGTQAAETQVMTILAKPLIVHQGSRSLVLSTGTSTLTLRPAR